MAFSENCESIIDQYPFGIDPPATPVFEGDENLPQDWRTYINQIVSFQNNELKRYERNRQLHGLKLQKFERTLNRCRGTIGNETYTMLNDLLLSDLNDYGTNGLHYNKYHELALLSNVMIEDARRAIQRANLYIEQDAYNECPQKEDIPILRSSPIIPTRAHLAARSAEEQHAYLDKALKDARTYHTDRATHTNQLIQLQREVQECRHSYEQFAPEVYLDLNETINSEISLNQRGGARFSILEKMTNQVRRLRARLG